jgi:CMP-N-acetylneuraminic acid synthetase
MSTMQNILAIIPARAGSKRVKDKNIQQFDGKPLLVHSIEQGLQSSMISRVIVSTDSQYYIDIAMAAGADAPFLRPADISSDLSTDLESFTHALRWLADNEQYVPEVCVHLRPTYPLRNIADIDAMIQILLDNPELDSVRSLAPAADPAFKMWTMDEHNMITPVAKSEIKDAHNLPRQLLPQTYLQNACIDVVRTSTILGKQSMTGDRIYGYEMREDTDIDTHKEFASAQLSAAKSHLTAAPIGTGSVRTFCFDIDGVIASITPGNDYNLCEPIHDMIAVVRKLYAAGHRIIFHTARGSMTGMDWKELTEKQLKEWNIPYHELHFGKPAADLYIDDKAVASDTIDTQTLSTFS